MTLLLERSAKPIHITLSEDTAIETSELAAKIYEAAGVLETTTRKLRSDFLNHPEIKPNILGDLQLFLLSEGSAAQSALITLTLGVADPERPFIRAYRERFEDLKVQTVNTIEAGLARRPEIANEERGSFDKALHYLIKRGIELDLLPKNAEDFNIPARNTPGKPNISFTGFVNRLDTNRRRDLQRPVSDFAI